MTDQQKFFPKGLFFNLPHPNAPDFVRGVISIKVADFGKYLSRVQGEWLNIDLKVSKDGKPYAEINTFKPEKQDAKEDSVLDDSSQNWADKPGDDDLPF